MTYLAWRRLRRRTAIVNTRSGKAFRGILWRRAGRLIVLRGATLHEAGQVVPVDGEVVIERDNIDFYQVLPPGSDAR